MFISEGNPLCICMMNYFVSWRSKVELKIKGDFWNLPIVEGYFLHFSIYFLLGHHEIHIPSNCHYPYDRNWYLFGEKKSGKPHLQIQGDVMRLLMLKRLVTFHVYTCPLYYIYFNFCLDNYCYWRFLEILLFLNLTKIIG